MPRWDHLWTNANLATMTARGGAPEAPPRRSTLWRDPERRTRRQGRPDRLGRPHGRPAGRRRHARHTGLARQRPLDHAPA